MSTTVSIPSAARNRVLAAGALVAAVAVTVTLAITGNEGDTPQRIPSVDSAPAAPDGASGAERFHHFR
jgi:hypothetical protein